MTIVGAVFLPQLAPERLRSIASVADESGLAELWFWEDCFRESGIATASAALAWTERVTVGIGLLPVPLRNVALTAMETATLHRLFPGRVTVGFGHGVQDWMGQVGARVESPITLLGEYVTALTGLFRGETVTTAGRYVSLEAVRLDWPPLTVPPILVGAGKPRSLRLSGRLADGTLLTGGTSPDGVRKARALIEEGRRAVGRTDPHRVVVNVMAATGPGAEQRLRTEQQAWGFDLSDEVGVAGDAETVAAAVRRWADAGADTVVLQPTSDEPDHEGFMRFVATEVQPLVV
ncbi:MAG TPA: LLM class flavin-dependent oxidoreductase [Cellulomonadaceae bacterium]|nr:LLM class flavin-dependent oxidoreductase [Cellulomonadaceae bacterium]